MAKIVIPEHLKGKELYSFLAANKTALIAQKKALPKHAEAVSYVPELFILSKEGNAVKTELGSVSLIDATTLRVKTVANTALWLDSHRDVTIPDCWNKSIQERKSFMKHLHDHKYTLDAEIGDVVDVQSVTMSWKDLGVDRPGKTQCLVFISDVKEEYNKTVFKKYKAGKVNQHSIGLWYVNIKLAINDADYKDEFAIWNKYIDKIANKEAAEEGGYFWALVEIRVIENSAVLFGSNIVTPTLEVEEKSHDTEEEPSDDTPDQPSDSNKSMFAKLGAGLQPQSSMIGNIGKQLNNK